MCRAEYSMSLSALYVKTLQERPDISFFSTGILFESLVSRARNSAAAAALHYKCDYLLFVDADVNKKVIQKYKIQNDEVVFLSANTWDISGGGNFGYNAVWVNRNSNVFDNLDYVPKNEIRNLKELLEIV